MKDEDLEEMLGNITEEDNESVVAEQISNHKKTNLRSNIAIIISLGLLATLGIGKYRSMRMDEPDPRLPFIAVGKEKEYFRDNAEERNTMMQDSNLVAYSQIPNISSISQLGQFKRIPGSKLEVKAISSKVNISKPKLAGVGNYAYHANDRTYIHGNGFIVKEGNRIYIPTNQGDDRSQTVIHDDYFRRNATIGFNSRGHEALKLQTFLYSYGYKEVGALDSWAGRNTMAALRSLQKKHSIITEGGFNSPSKKMINILAGTYLDTDNCIVMEYDKDQSKYVISTFVQDGEFYTGQRSYKPMTINSSKGMNVKIKGNNYEFNKFRRSGRIRMVEINRG